ncbi:MAG: formyltransferase family protein [Halobacteria archaeon]|nr:formyltransferase family protein [Halobacteria archaeon]
MSLFDLDRSLRVVVFFSGGASGLRYLARHDPNYGDKYEVVGAFTDSPDARGVEFVRDEGIRLKTNDLDEFYAERDADTRDLDVREEYDSQTADIIDEFDADLLLLSGYMRILTSPVVSSYPIINVHPADLTVRDDGERVYTGFDPVYDAVVSGEEYTRSSVHFVTQDVDEGPLLTLSKRFEVHRELVDSLMENASDDAVQSYCESHQEWMKWEGDGPALAKAVELIADGRVERDGSDVYIDGEIGHYSLDSASASSQSAR